MVTTTHSTMPKRRPVKSTVKPIDLAAYRARKTAQRLNDGSFLERMAMSPLVWPSGKGPVR